MENYLTLEKFLEFTKPVLSHMENNSKNEKLLIAVKNRLLKAESEIVSLKESIKKQKVNEEYLDIRINDTLVGEIQELKEEKRKFEQVRGC